MRHKLIVMSFFSCKVIRKMTQDIEYVEQSFQVVKYSTICTGHIYHIKRDVIIVEVTITKPRF